MNLAYEAMVFAREVHKNQKRKYTGQPYADHLAEVAGIMSSVISEMAGGAFDLECIMATCWLHDSVEDCGVSIETLKDKFNGIIAEGVQLLSDLEEGNRATRKRLSRERLSQAPGWVQTIKTADLISNTSSIVQHDPDFARVYLHEKRLLLEVMTKADKRLWQLAYDLANKGAV